MVLIIKKFWSLIMDNEQLFDLTSTPSADFDTTQDCFDTAIIMQNRTAMQWCSYYSKKLSRQFLRWLVGGERENYSCDQHAAEPNQRTNINWASPGSNPSRQGFLLPCQKQDFMFHPSKNQKEFERSLEPVLDECTGIYWSVYGFPCAHIMQQMQRALSSDNIYSQWHLDWPVILPLLPVAQSAKVRILSYCKEE